MKKVFLLILAGGIMMNACKKENEMNTKTSSIVNFTKSVPKKPKPASNGRELKEGYDDCVNNPVACAPYDVVVTPTGTSIKCYMNFLNSISAGKEHEFFADKEQVEMLFPFLLDKEWAEFYELTLNPEMKFIEQKNEKTGKYFYFLVPDDLNPKEFKIGMDYLDLVVEYKK